MTHKRTLLLCRHAKSSWDHPGRDDIDRPLNNRGVKNAYEMANRMKKRGDKPQFIISSPANRALHTASIFARELDFPYSRFRIDSHMYMSGEDSILNIIYGMEKDITSLMLFGHNPDLTYLTNFFLSHPLNDLPTCGLISLDFSAEGWELISRQNLSGHYLDFPKRGSRT